MKIKTTYLLILPLLFLFLISMNSCKEKGCTDPSAINYNSVADDDDGSCIYCTGQIDTAAMLSENMLDNSSSGPHPFQNVATFYINQVKSQYNNSICGSSTCYFIVYVKSLVNEKMTFNYSMQVSGQVNFNRFTSISVDGNQTIFVDSVPSNVVSNPCGSLLGSSVFISQSGTIFYH